VVLVRACIAGTRVLGRHELWRVDDLGVGGRGVGGGLLGVSVASI
jgi:hypothetical protein